MVLVWKFDRFSRSREDSVVYKALLRREKVNVVSVAEPTDAESPSSVMTEGMLEVVAEWYSADLRHKVSASKRERVEKGLWNGDLPFGYRHPGDARRPPLADEDAAEGVRLAFHEYGTGRYTMSDVARILNQSGYRTTNKKGSRLWSRDSIRELLANRFYLGEVAYKGEWRLGQQEPVVTQEEFRRCEELRRERYRGPRTFAPKFRTYILGGLARCNVCGERLTGNATGSGQGYLYYRETSRKRGLVCLAPQTSVPARVLDEQIGRIVRSLRLPKDWQARIVEIAAGEDTSARVAAERIVLEEQLRRVRRQHLDLEIDDQEYETRRRQLRAKLDALEVPQQETMEVGARQLKDLSLVWEVATAEEKRDLPKGDFRRCVRESREAANRVAQATRRIRAALEALWESERERRPVLRRTRGVWHWRPRGDSESPDTNAIYDANGPDECRDSVR